jgi:ComF family protein
VRSISVASEDVEAARRLHKTDPVRAAAEALVRVLLAPTCCVCDEVLDAPLGGPACPACWRAVARLTPPTCPRCGDALPSAAVGTSICMRCRDARLLMTTARSAGLYGGSLRDIIHAFKYGGRRPLAMPLAALMREAGRDLLVGVDAVVPVPLHPWRSLRRGFNQADDLARCLGPPVWRVLRRRRHGPPQAALAAEARHTNVRAAFGLAVAWRLRGAWRRRVPEDVAGPLDGRTLVLIDDVMTTGATLDACARVLLDAGAAEVRGLTAARVVAGRRPPPRARPDLSIARRR